MRGAREAVFLAGALALCPLAALLIGSDPTAPVQRAMAVSGVERSLGVHVEPAIHHWTLGHPQLLALACWIYVWAHVPIAGWALVWTWFLRRDAFPVVRNAFLAAQAITVAIYVVVPVAPPRLLAGEGFTDTLSGQWGRAFADSTHLLQSPYAAMPSGHVAFALLAGGTFALLGDRRWLRAFGWAYPPLVVLVTLATANHFVVDAVAACVVVAVSVALARAVAVRHRALGPAIAPPSRSVGGSTKGLATQGEAGAVPSPAPPLVAVSRCVPRRVGQAHRNAWRTVGGRGAPPNRPAGGDRVVPVRPSGGIGSPGTRLQRSGGRTSA